MKTGPRRWPDAVIALAIFAVCLAVYNATLTPSLSYKSPDGNELATVCYTLGLAHSTGYPLYTWLGKLFTFLPIGDVAHRVNLMSAVLGAAGVAFLNVILRQLTVHHTVPPSDTPSRVASAFGALLFGFSLTFWSQTGIAEVYAVNLFMVTVTVMLLLHWAGAHQRGSRGSVLWLWVFALIYGLSLGTHMSNLGFAPAFALFILLLDWRILLRPWIWLTGIALFALGVLQFLWLPYKAGTLNDVNMLRHVPSTLEGIYSYTLGAFPDFKFAFPLAAIPERIVLYLHLLAQNFGVAGILIGLLGMAGLLWQRPRRFFLLMGMYLINVWFFIQYRAFDIDVFFIPAHFVYAVFIGFGIHIVLSALASHLPRARSWHSVVRIGMSSLIATALILIIAGEVEANWERNDYSGDTAINDFYANVFDLLPPDGALLGRGGVFGYDMFYFRLVYDYRPDIAIPMIDGPQPSPQELAGRPIYATQPLQSGRGGGGPWSPPPGLVPSGAWYVPVLLGQSGVGTGMRDSGQPLSLYAVRDVPPNLVVASAEPEHSSGQMLEGLELVGYDLDGTLARPGGRLHLTLYWRGRPPAGSLIVTTLDGTPLEHHQLGLGNLARYAQEVRSLRNGIIVEDYWAVIPSTAEPGVYSLKVGLQPPLRTWSEESPLAEGHVELGQLAIVENGE